MPLLIPSYPNPQDASTPIVNAYGRVRLLQICPVTGFCQAVLEIFGSSALAGVATNQPITTLTIALGSTVGGVVLPTLAALQADPTFAAAMLTIQTKLLNAVVAIPALAGSTIQ